MNKIKKREKIKYKILTYNWTKNIHEYTEMEGWKLKYYSKKYGRGFAMNDEYENWITDIKTGIGIPFLKRKFIKRLAETADRRLLRKKITYGIN